MKTRNIFISGASGYIGQELVKKALEKGWVVHAFSRRPVALEHQHLKIFTGDVCNLSEVEAAMKGCDFAIHSAAFTRLHAKDRNKLFSINVTGTSNVLEAALKYEIEKLVFTSSAAVAGPSTFGPVTEDDPRLTPFDNDYEISKHCAEQLVKEYADKGLHTVIVRPSRVYGPGGPSEANAVTNFIEKGLRRKMIFIPTVKGIMGNYVFAKDVVEGHFAAVEKGGKGAIYHLGGVDSSYEDLFGLVKKHYEGNLSIIPVPPIALKIFSFLSWLFAAVCFRHTNLTPKTVSRMLSGRRLSSNKAILELGYQITPLEEGILQTLKSLKHKE